MYSGEASSDCTAFLINDGLTVAQDVVSVQFNREGRFSSYLCTVDGNIQRGVCKFIDIESWLNSSLVPQASRLRIFPPLRKQQERRSLGYKAS